MLGLYFLAIANNAFNVFYDSPTYLDIKSDADILKKVPPFIYVAHAFAKNVLPVPGGPYNNMPFHGVLCPTKTYGCLIGNITAYWSTVFACYNPDTSSHLMFGFYFTIAADNYFSISF